MSKIPPRILWPAIIISLLVANIGIAVGTLIISKSDGGAQVVPEYYSQAVAWDSLNTVKQESANLGWDVQIRASRSDRKLIVDISDSENTPVGGLETTVVVSQPQLSAPLDTVVMQESEPGRYISDQVVFGTPGFHDFQISASGSDVPFVTSLRLELQ